MKNLFPKIKQPFFHWRTRDWLIPLGMLLVTLAISAPMFIRRVYTPTGDYLDHILFAQYILTHQYQKLHLFTWAHPFYQFLLVGIHLLSLHVRKISLFAAATIVEVAAQLLSVLLIYLWLGRVERKNWNVGRAAWAVALTIVAPVMLFVFRDELYYFGYIGLANYHNPTINLLKPVAIISFIFATRVFSGQRNSWLLIASSAVLTILSAAIKPSYLTCILPALAVLALLFLVQKKKLDWRLLLLGFVLPGTLILLAQWLVTYYIPGGDNTIIFSPLGVVSLYSGYLLPKLFLSILFPLAVLIFDFRRVRGDTVLLLAWAGFLVSLVPTYFLAEKARFAGGNFLWGAQIMLFLLFVASARHFLREGIATDSLACYQKVVIYIAFAVHVIAGIVYYLYAFLTLVAYPF